MKVLNLRWAVTGRLDTIGEKPKVPWPQAILGFKYENQYLEFCLGAKGQPVMYSDFLKSDISRLSVLFNHIYNYCCT